jgi:cephalosporin hydroxylase
MLKPVIPWDKIPGWFDYADIYDHAVETAENGYHFVEIGSHQGRSTAYLATKILKSGKKIKLDACDIWTDYWDQVFLNNMRKVGVVNRITPLHMPSVQAAKLYKDKSLDFIWIDADHTYEAVKEDIEAWFPKLKSHRYLAGHDYGNREFPGVKQAVDEFFDGKAEQAFLSWIYFKP